MTQWLQYCLPYPLTDIVSHLYKAARADRYTLDDATCCTAVKVIMYALARFALAGALYYVMNKYGTDPTRTMAAGLFVSTPATALCWSGKCLVTGVRVFKTNYCAPFTRDVAIAALKILAAFISAAALKGPACRAGLVEWQVFPRIFGELEIAEPSY